MNLYSIYHTDGVKGTIDCFYDSFYLPVVGQLHSSEERQQKTAVLHIMNGAEKHRMLDNVERAAPMVK